MRISDWSSDVCSSDLPDHHGGGSARHVDAAGQFPAPVDRDVRRFDAGDGAGLSRRVDGQLPPQPGTVQVRGRRRVRQFTLRRDHQARSEENTSELKSLMRISYAVFCLKKKTTSKKD